MMSKAVGQRRLPGLPVLLVLLASATQPGWGASELTSELTSWLDAVLVDSALAPAEDGPGSLCDIPQITCCAVIGSSSSQLGFAAPATWPSSTAGTSMAGRLGWPFEHNSSSIWNIETCSSLGVPVSVDLEGFTTLPRLDQFPAPPAELHFLTFGAEAGSSCTPVMFVCLSLRTGLYNLVMSASLAAVHTMQKGL